MTNHKQLTCRIIVFLCILILAACDDILGPALDPPLTPGLDSQRGDGKVTLRWTWRDTDLRAGPRQHEEPKAFEIYISEQSPQQLRLFNIVKHKSGSAAEGEFTLEGLKNDDDYYFAVRAIGESGKPSKRSNTIMVMPAPAENVKRLLAPAEYHRFSGSWSPDAQSTVFVTTQFRQTHMDHNIVQYSLENGQMRRLNFADDAFFPSWSPHGLQIAFDGETGYDETQIFIVHTTFDSVRQITREERINWDPTWSPDGKWLAYISGGGSRVHQLFKISVAGGDPIQLTYDAGSKFHPDWSPDGAYVLFSKEMRLEDGSYVRGLYKISADGGAPLLVSQSQWDSYYPTWSPDGSRIAYASSRSGHSDLWVLEIGSGTLKQVTGTAISHIWDPEWSPLDDRILFESSASIFIDLYLLTLN